MRENLNTNIPFRDRLPEILGAPTYGDYVRKYAPWLTDPFSMQPYVLRANVPHTCT